MKCWIGKGGVEQVAVLGAAGKMGRGISLLVLQELAISIAKHSGNHQARLTMIDSDRDRFSSLKHYLRDHLKKFAERNINLLRNFYQDRPEIIDNVDMIHIFVDEAMDCVYCCSELNECRGAALVLEAIVEDVEVKVSVFRELDRLLGKECSYFTNTSSIPIRVLEKKAGINGRIIGFHFYNPPAVQRLVELIFPDHVCEKTRDLAAGVAEQLNKVVVFSKDVAGFIGNGHFIREILFAIRQVNQLAREIPFFQAIFLVNQVTKQWLMRPMGIFQLLDYVGIDVAKRIAGIMSTYLGQSFEDQLIDTLVKEKRLGGQNPNGSQKEGIFRYEKGEAIEVYDPVNKNYVSCVDEAFLEACGTWLGPLPPKSSPWKVLSRDPLRAEKIKAYFKLLWQDESRGAEMARTFAMESKTIAEGLVKDCVAASLADVDSVLMNGFFHLYGVEVPFKASF